MEVWDVPRPVHFERINFLRADIYWWPRHIPRMNCPLSNGWLFQFISPAPERDKFCCNWIPAAMVLSSTDRLRKQNSQYWCKLPCKEQTSAKLNRPLLSCRRKICGLAAES